MNISFTKVYWSHENLPNDLFLLLEKLSQNNIISVKSLYDKYKVDNKKIKKKINRKEDLIQKNLKRIENKNIQSDKFRLDKFNESKTTDFETWISYFVTQQGKNLLKLATIKKYDNKKDILKKIELLLQLESSQFDKADDKKYIKKQKKDISKLNLNRIQMKCLGNRLPPLDFYNKTEFNLEDWQVKAIDCILKNQSLLVCAPTSSGKTMITTYFAEKGKKILYIVPSKPLAFQVAALFYKIVNECISIYVDDFTYTAPDAKVTIGTPYEIETKLLDNDFDLVIYDEIHNLNYHNGDSYERLIKIYNCNFIALSATISNADQLIEWWSGIHKNLKINKIVYEKRFINIQRSYWNERLKSIKKIHPLSCIEKETLNSNNIKNLDLPFTPWDSFSVWDSLKKIEPDLYKKLDPEIVFNDINRITLENSKDYEYRMKETLLSLNSETKDNLLKKYHIDQEPINKEFDILSLVLTLKKSKLNPSIIFNNDSLVCMNMFKKLIKLLENEEEKHFPFHYENLSFKHSIFIEYIKKKSLLEENTKTNEKYDILKKYDTNSLQDYILKLTDNYQKQLNKLKKNKDDKDDKDIDIKIKNLTESYNKDCDVNFIEEVDIFEKHSNYSFNKEPMKRDKIKKLKTIISKKLGIKIDYTNFLIQGLKRGIGVYTKNLPEVYLRIVQELAQNKELGIVFSDESLALGINMPFKSVIIAGWNNSIQFDKLLYHQMIGRAGRRGMDSEGNVIYVNIDWKSLIKMKMSIIKGNLNVLPNYQISDKMPITLDLNKTYNNYLYNYVDGSKNISYYKDIVYNINDTNYMNIIWKLRNKSNMVVIIDYINNLELNYKDCDVSSKIVTSNLQDMTKLYFSTSKSDSFEEVINNGYANKLCELLGNIFMTKQINLNISDYEKNELIKYITDLGNLNKYIYNTILLSNINTSIKDIILKSFTVCKTLFFKYLELN